MWGGHRSPGEYLDRSVVESRNDVETRSPDVDAGTGIREGSFGVGDGGGGNSDSLPDACRRDILNVLVLVSGSNDNGYAGIKQLEEE